MNALRLISGVFVASILSVLLIKAAVIGVIASLATFAVVGILATNRI